MKKTGPFESSRIATAISARRGESSEQADRRAGDVQAALGGLREARERRLADRHQRHAADLLGARTVEELEQARDDVHGHARVAADADRVQQVLVGGARERDHHAIDAAEGDQVAERVQRAEPRDAEAAGLLDVVVDVADGVQPELRVALEALHELQGDVARAEDERSLAQGGRAVQADACGGAAEAGAGAADHGGGQRADHRGPAFEQVQHAVQRPGDEQRGHGEARGLADTAGPGAQVVDGVQAADVGEHRPAESDGQGDDGNHLDPEPRREGDDRSGDRTGDDVGGEQLTTQLRLPATSRWLCGYERLSEDVRRGAQTSPCFRRCHLRAQNCVLAWASHICPGILSVNPRSLVILARLKLVRLVPALTAIVGH